ncbi:MAG: phosphoribosylformylglycinamidine synthase subunit PurS [Thermoplasmata archaeon]|nr:phosphoribosylformylglycinamidine synthase subunit PurS [Thermoplasmata archaeon]
MVKVKIIVSYKEGVEDPEGLAIKKSLNLLNFNNVKNVTVSKLYEINIEGDSSSVKKEAEEMCDKLLVNPVIHKYKIEVEKI